MTEAQLGILRGLLQDAEVVQVLKQICEEEETYWKNKLVSEMQRLNPDQPPNLLLSAAYASRARQWCELPSILRRHAKLPEKPHA